MTEFTLVHPISKLPQLLGSMVTVVIAPDYRGLLDQNSFSGILIQCDDLAVILKLTNSSYNVWIPIRQITEYWPEPSRKFITK